MVRKIINEKKETRSIIEIDGVKVEVVIYGYPNCFPTEADKEDIQSSMKRGVGDGTLCSNQAHKETCIYGRWRKVDIDVGVGSIVEFSTSAKYNPGFHTTNKYVGTITGIMNGRWMVEVEDIGRAFIPSKHIERILKR